MFRESIQKMVDRLDPAAGGAGLLMGLDGIAVESYVRPGAVDAQIMSMEIAHVIGQIRRSAHGAHLGGLREIEVKTDRLTVLIRLVNDEYFVAFGVAPDSNLGKARYLLRLLSPQIRAQL